MAESDKDIVALVRDAIAKEIGQGSLDLWLGHPAAIRSEDGLLIFCAADGFSLDRIRGKLRAELMSAVHAVCGAAAKAEFRVDESLKRSNSPGRKPRPAKPIDPNQRVFGFAEDGEDESSEAVDETKLEVPVIAPAAPARQERFGRKFARLDTFVTGDENQLAHAASRSVGQRLGEVSPLYLYGPTGCGKTHLAEGIWSTVRHASSANRCVYLAAEQFTTLFIEAINGKGLPSFRHKVRDVDLLVIDDVQFLSGKRATLQELLSTVDHFARERKQLVLAADRSAAQLPGLGELLQARVSGGLVVEMKSPDEATRVGMLKNFLVERGYRLSADVLEFLARELPPDGRQMVGALNRLEAIREATGRAMNVTLAREVLKDVLRASRKMIRLMDIEKIVCETFHIPPGSLKTEAKVRSVTQPRMLALWLARKYTRAGLSEIGQHFGLRSHSTVISAQKKVKSWLDSKSTVHFPHGDCEAEEAIRRLESALRAM